MSQSLKIGLILRKSNYSVINIKIRYYILLCIFLVDAEYIYKKHQIYINIHVEICTKELLLGMCVCQCPRREKQRSLVHQNYLEKRQLLILLKCLTYMAAEPRYLETSRKTFA